MIRIGYLSDYVLASYILFRYPNYCSTNAFKSSFFPRTVTQYVNTCPTPPPHPLSLPHPFQRYPTHHTATPPPLAHS